jgi:aspartate aminotransferase-like enzyme
MAAHPGGLMYFKFLALVLALVSGPLTAGAQPVTGKVPRVGVLGVTSAAGYARQIEAMRQGFRDLGYVEGQRRTGGQVLNSDIPVGRCGGRPA